MNFFSWFTKQKTTTAISFDHNILRYVAVEKKDNVIDIVDYGSLVFDESVIDQRGTIVDDLAFVQKMKELCLLEKTFHKLRTVNIVIPDAQAVLFHTHVVKEQPKEMNDIIIDHIKTYLQAHHLLSYPEYVCEYDIIQETDFGYDLHVTLVPKMYIDHLKRLLKQVGITVRHIETAHHSIASACTAVPAGSAYISVMMGTYTTMIALIHEDHLVSQERINLGTEHLLKTIQAYLSIDRETAQRILGKHGLLGTHPDTGLLGELHLAMAPLWRTIDKQIIEHGQRPYKIFGHRFTVSHIMVYGDGVTIKGLPVFLEHKTNLPTAVLDIWQGRHDMRAPIMRMPAQQACVYAEALSLALVCLGE